MARQRSSAVLTHDPRFNDRFPSAIVTIIAIIQMMATLAIIALEIGHDIIHLQLTNLFAGFWTSIPFTISWISMFTLICCCRHRTCATRVLVQSIISFVFAGVLIGINYAFIRRPDRCFFTDRICESLSGPNFGSSASKCVLSINSYGCDQTRIVLIKAQLAAGIVMAVTCIAYLIVYIISASRASRNRQSYSTPAANAVMAPVYQTPHPANRGQHQQQQPYTIPAHPYQPSAPVMPPAYTPSAPTAYPTIYPKLTNNQF